MLEMKRPSNYAKKDEFCKKKSLQFLVATKIQLRTNQNPNTIRNTFQYCGANF